MKMGKIRRFYVDDIRSKNHKLQQGLVLVFSPFLLKVLIKFSPILLELSNFLVEFADYSKFSRIYSKI